MTHKNPFHVVKHRYITEKTTVLENLKSATSNPSVRRCESPKYTFVVDPTANKHEIKDAVERIYAHRNIKVKAVNTSIMKPKQQNRRGNRQPGKTNLMKKAIVTLQRGDSIED